MTTTEARTPRWLLSCTECADGSIDLWQPNGVLIATVQRGAGAYAAEIARAVNSHAALLAACEATERLLDMGPVSEQHENDILRQLRAAIAQAKETP